MDGLIEGAGWQPGRPVVTAQDHTEWQAWRRARILEGQRERRKQIRRIDYYPSARGRRGNQPVPYPLRRQGCQLDPEPDRRRMGRCFRNKIEEKYQ
jgi:hypothetical protein